MSTIILYIICAIPPVGTAVLCWRDPSGLYESARQARRVERLNKLIAPYTR